KLEATDDTSRRLVLLTPHNEALRYEMSRGFRGYLKQRGLPPVTLDWRSPGGTTELMRYLSSEYRSAFEQYFAKETGTSLTERGAQAFADPKQKTEGDDEPARARRLFMSSNVGIKIDVLFGGGSYDFSQHAAAGRLVDSGVIAKHPELFGDGGIPHTVGGEPYWDKQGRWIGTCVSGFGICYNVEALAQLGIARPPTRWADLADPRLAGHVALADPSKSGSANKAFELIIQQQMSAALSHAGSPAAGSPAELSALASGFDDGMRLIRKIGGVSRYFSDQAGKVAQDVQNGSAAVGMCIDFYGRFESDTEGPGQRLKFVLPEGGTSMGADAIGLLRGAPAAELGRTFIEFVLSPEGQALWAYKRGVPGGPERYALRRTPILPELFEPSRRALRSDPDDNPYLNARSFTYRAAWTAPLFRALSFVIRVMCVDTEEELHEASAELERAKNPPRARAAFDDMSLVSYAVIKNEIAPALASGEPLREVALQNRLVTALKHQYEQVSALARSGQ
ncbi:MAG TPA: ABC transporter substrate-binding protein, partial [Polyangiaceae bacterium]|nr:ABC transporter substrate-binding protein [Polyangiaceae bacterium]